MPADSDAGLAQNIPPLPLQSENNVPGVFWPNAGVGVYKGMQNEQRIKPT